MASLLISENLPYMWRLLTSSFIIKAIKWNFFFSFKVIEISHYFVHFILQKFIGKSLCKLFWFQELLLKGLTNFCKVHCNDEKSHTYPFKMAAFCLKSYFLHCSMHPGSYDWLKSKNEIFFIKMHFISQDEPTFTLNKQKPKHWCVF